MWFLFWPLATHIADADLDVDPMYDCKQSGTDEEFFKNPGLRTHITPDYQQQPNESYQWPIVCAFDSSLSPMRGQTGGPYTPVSVYS